MSKKKPAVEMIDASPVEESHESAVPETDINAQLDAIEAQEAQPAETVGFTPTLSQAAIDAYAEFQTNPERIFYFREDEINIDHSLNGRRKHRSISDKDIQEMAEDIKLNGILAPLMGFFEEGTNLPYIVFGYGRAMALQLANSQLPEDQQMDLPVIFNPNVTTKAQALLLNISENVKRKDLTALDIADDMQRLKDAGLQNIEIAQQFSMAKSGVTGYLSILKLPTWIQDRIADNTLSFRNALDLVALMKDEKDKEAGLRKVESTAKKLVEKNLQNVGGKKATVKKALDSPAAATASPVSGLNLKEAKELFAGSTGPGEDARVMVVNMVLAALLSGTSEKEFGIGKVTAKNYTTKLAAALGQVSTVNRANKGKAA